MAQLMGSNHGYVYYDADCFGLCVNPFIDPHIENPTMVQFLQKPLKVYKVYFSIDLFIYNTILICIQCFTFRFLNRTFQNRELKHWQQEVNLFKKCKMAFLKEFTKPKNHIIKDWLKILLNREKDWVVIGLLPKQYFPERKENFYEP